MTGILVLERDTFIKDKESEVSVYINGKYTDALKSGELKKYNLPVGHYTIELAQNYKHGKCEITIQETEVVYLVFAPDKLWHIAGIVLLAGFVISLLIGYKNMSYSFLFFVPGVFITLYSLKKGKESDFKFTFIN